jgi:predicted ester cyclase
MSDHAIAEAAKAVIRRNTEEVQGAGKFDVFDELFAADYVDHTPQQNCAPDREGTRGLYQGLRAAFSDFRAEIHWQTADRIDGELVTTYKTYHGTHRGEFLGIAATGRKIHFESVDVMRVHDGKITEHWGAGNIYSVILQLGAKVN